MRNLRLRVIRLVAGHASGDERRDFPTWSGRRGLLHSGRVGLAMRRLAIIDVAGGSQPVYNEDRSVAVVFNGEIYNYKTLREPARTGS